MKYASQPFIKNRNITNAYAANKKNTAAATLRRGWVKNAR